MAWFWFDLWISNSNQSRTKHSFYHLVEQLSGVIERCGKHKVFYLKYVDCSLKVESVAMQNFQTPPLILNPDCFFSRCKPFFLHMHESRSHLKRNHFIVRCKLVLSRTWKLYARERSLLFACYCQQINTTLTQMHKYKRHDKHIMPRLKGLSLYL